MYWTANRVEAGAQSLVQDLGCLLHKVYPVFNVGKGGCSSLMRNWDAALVHWETAAISAWFLSPGMAGVLCMKAPLASSLSSSPPPSLTHVHLLMPLKWGEGVAFTPKESLRGYKTEAR